jgi:hypothetical protein
MLEISTKVELKSKIKNARTMIRLRINTKISCQSFICYDRLVVLTSVFSNLSPDRFYQANGWIIANIRRKRNRFYVSKVDLELLTEN